MKTIIKTTMLLFICTVMLIALCLCDDGTSTDVPVAVLTGYTQGSGSNGETDNYSGNIKVMLVDISSTGYELSMDGSNVATSDEEGLFSINLNQTSSVPHLPVLRGFFSDRVRRSVIDFDIAFDETQDTGNINDETDVEFGIYRALILLGYPSSEITYECYGEIQNMVSSELANEVLEISDTDARNTYLSELASGIEDICF